MIEELHKRETVRPNELLMAKMPSSHSSLHFFLTGQYLIAANTGHLFSKSGLKSICRSYLSAKEQSNESKLFSAEQEAIELMKSLREKRNEVYRTDPTQFEEDCKSQEYTRKDYAQRVLLELMQNADDANGEEPIGYKGLGFKSVLNVTISPRIHSGYLHCEFNPQKCSNELTNAGIQTDISSCDLPILRFPFPFPVDNEPQRIKEMISKYSTVIILPFTNSLACKRLQEEWSKCIENITVLLFLHRLERVIWVSQDQEKHIWYCNRKANDKNADLFSVPKSDLPKKWQINRFEECALAVPLDLSERPAPLKEYLNLRVFFPTKETNPFPFLLHGIFPLTQNRNYVLLDDEDGETEDAISNMVEMIENFLTEIDSTGLFLDLLKPRIDPTGMEGLEKYLWESVLDKLIDMPLPGSDSVALRNINICPQNNELPYSWIRSDAFRLNLWNKFKEILKQYRPNGLKSLNFLPPGVDNEDREKTLLAVNPSARLSAEELRELPILPIEGKDIPFAPSQVLIFMPPKDQPPIPPKEIPMQFVDRKFLKTIQEEEYSKAFNEFLILKCCVKISLVSLYALIDKDFRST